MERTSESAEAGCMRWILVTEILGASISSYVKPSGWKGTRGAAAAWGARGGGAERVTDQSGAG